MKQDLETMRVLSDTPRQVLSADGGDIAVSALENLGGILSGGGDLARGINTKTTTIDSRETKTYNFNNGTTIAAIIGAAVVLTVIVVVIFKRKA